MFADQSTRRIPNRNRQEQRETCHLSGVTWPGPSPLAIIAPGKRVTRSLGFLPRLPPVLRPSALPLSHLLLDRPQSSVAVPRFQSSIRCDVRRRACEAANDATTIDVRSDPRQSRMRCFCVNITPFFLSGTHARSWARNRGPASGRSRGEA